MAQEIKATSKVTWLDAARGVARLYDEPELTDKELDHILWNFTAFPFGDLVMTLKQLHEYFCKDGIYEVTL